MKSPSGIQTLHLLPESLKHGESGVVGCPISAYTDDSATFLTPIETFTVHIFIQYMMSRDIFVPQTFALRTL